MNDPAANERLTAVAAVPLFVLLAAEGVTLLFLRSLLPEHIVIGLLLVPPVALKLGSTGWRFLRYYRGDPEYVRRGPPTFFLRLLAPVLVLSTVLVLASGIALVLAPSHRNLLLLLHKASFVIWGPTFGVHVLAYVWRVPALALGAARLHRYALVGTLAVAAVAAVAFVDVGHPAMHWADFDDYRLSR